MGIWKPGFQHEVNLYILCTYAIKFIEWHSNNKKEQVSQNVTKKLKNKGKPSVPNIQTSGEGKRGYQLPV